MPVPQFTKQNYEQFFIGGDFSQVIDTTEETIVLGSSSVVCVNGSGTVVTDTYDNSSLQVETDDDGNDTILSVRCKGGTEADSTYKFTFKIVTTSNNKWEVDVKMKIRET